MIKDAEMNEGQAVPLKSRHPGQETQQQLVIKHLEGRPGLQI